MGDFTAATCVALTCANDNESIAAFLLDARGHTAALAGIALAANPYRDGSYEASCWSSGWETGARELMMERRDFLRHKVAAPMLYAV